MSVQLSIIKRCVQEPLCCEGTFFVPWTGKNPKKWWDEVKRVSGAKSRNGNLLNLINIEQFSSLSGPDQANAINSAFRASSSLQVTRATCPLPPGGHTQIFNCQRRTCPEGLGESQSKQGIRAR